MQTTSTTPKPPFTPGQIAALREMVRRLAAAVQRFRQAVAQATRQLAHRWAALHAERFPQPLPRLALQQLQAAGAWYGDIRAGYGTLAAQVAGPLAQAQARRLGVV